MADAALSLLDVLTEDDRRSVLSRARRHKYRKGDTLFHEGDPGDTLHLIEKGHVAIRTTTPMGDGATLAVLGPGEAFGEQALVMAHNTRSASAIALEAVETRAIHRDQFEELRTNHPAVDRFLVEALGETVRRVSEHLLEALYVPVEKRVLRRLAALAELYDPSGGPVVVPFTQDDVASLAGTTRPTANRFLKAAQDAGIVTMSRGRIKVLDRAALIHKAR